MRSPATAALFALAVGAPAAAAPPRDMYLPASQTGGATYIFNPQSRALRAALKGKTPKPGDLYDARAVADDLAFLRGALRKEYAGYPELLQQPAFDVEGLFDEHIAKLRRRKGRVTFEASMVAVYRALKQQINDRHLVLDGASEDATMQYVEYQAPVPPGTPRPERCTLDGAAVFTRRVAPVVAVGAGAAAVLTVSAHPRGETVQLACEGGERDLTLRPRSSGEPDRGKRPAYEWRRHGDAAIIRIRRLQGSPEDRTRLEQIAADYDQHRTAKVVVFDLRGNSGGNDSYVYKWIAQARRGKWDGRWWQVYPAGSHSGWLRWNHAVVSDIHHDRIDDPQAVSARDALRADWPSQPSETRLRFRDAEFETDARTPYEGRVFALVDHQTASSGESSAWLLRQALGAPIVGERTAGYKEYGNQRALVLPRTGVVWLFATKRNHFTQPVESVGVPPDHYLPADLMDAPAEQLLPALRALAPQR